MNDHEPSQESARWYLREGAVFVDVNQGPNLFVFSHFRSPVAVNELEQEQPVAFLIYRVKTRSIARLMRIRTEGAYAWWPISQTRDDD